MLSLSRYPGETIVLFDKDEKPIAEIKINSNRGSQISVGMQAKKEIQFVRSELIEEGRLREIREALK